MRVTLSVLAVMSIGGVLAAPGHAQDVIFATGFESGRLCAWSSDGCTAEDLVGDLENAGTVGENAAALIAALESVADAVPPQVLSETVVALAELYEAYPETKGGLMRIADAHALATLEVDGAPTLSEALTRLTADIQQAYADPQAAGSVDVILMFSAAAPLASPLPISGDTRLTAAGAMLYGGWLANAFPGRMTARVAPATCHLLVAASETNAVTEILVRNVMVAVARVAMAIFDAAEVIAGCDAGILTLVKDATLDCGVGLFTEWYQVDAPAECVGNVPEVPAIGACVAAMLPCLGDVTGAINNAWGAVAALENTVNGICTVVGNHQPAHETCDSGCDDLTVIPACSWSNVWACFDPLTAVPTVECSGGGDELTVYLPGGVPLTLVRIPAGTFWMGSPEDEPARDSDETLHQVTLTQDYYLGKYEVTQGQWEAVMGTNPSSFSSCGLDCPVESVSWDDICGGTTGSDCTSESFIGRLNAHLATTAFRLPTEAEWERAARGGTQTPFSFTTPATWDTVCGSFPEALPYMWWCNNSGNRTHQVGSKQPNPYGLHDMHGNVWEWVADWYIGSLGTAAVTDPVGASTGSNRVFRGSDWSSAARFCRSANRTSVDPAYAEYYLGFRLARTP